MDSPHSESSGEGQKAEEDRAQGEPQKGRRHFRVLRPLSSPPLEGEVSFFCFSLNLNLLSFLCNYVSVCLHVVSAPMKYPVLVRVCVYTVCSVMIVNLLRACIHHIASTIVCGALRRLLFGGRLTTMF